jgi:putative transposase
MPEYRRVYRPGGTYFFSIVTYQRRQLFADLANVERLRAAVRAVMGERPFDFEAGVILPDHGHFLWTLPPGDSDYSTRIGRMKVLFTKSLREAGVIADARGGAVGDAHPTAVGGAHPTSRDRHREADVWQRRFWEHTIRDEQDYENHLNYIHFNPVKHGLVNCPHLWAASSFEHWVERKVYDREWCCACDGRRVIVPYSEEFDARMNAMIGE